MLLARVSIFLTGIRIFCGQNGYQDLKHPVTDPPVTINLPPLALAGVAFLRRVFIPGLFSY